MFCTTGQWWLTIGFCIHCIACLYVNAKPSQRRPTRVSNINCFLELKFSSKNIKEIHISVKPLLFLSRYNNLLLHIQRFHVQCSFCPLSSTVVHAIECVRMLYMKNFRTTRIDGHAFEYCVRSILSWKSWEMENVGNIK